MELNEKRKEVSGGDLCFLCVCVCLVVVGCFEQKVSSEAPAEELSFHFGAQTLARNTLLFLWPYAEDIPPLKLHIWGSGGGQGWVWTHYSYRDLGHHFLAVSPSPFILNTININDL